MAVMKKTISKGRRRLREERIFSRSTTHIRYCLEDENESVENDFLPLLVKEGSGYGSMSILSANTNNLKLKADKDEKIEISPPKTVVASSRKNRLSLRNLFSGNRKYTRNKRNKSSVSNRCHQLDLDNLPELSVMSKDTEDQSDCEVLKDDRRTAKETSSRNLLVIKPSAHTKKIQSAGNDYTCTQNDLITFLTEIQQDTVKVDEDISRDTVNVLNELVCMETSRCKELLQNGVHSAQEGHDGNYDHHLISRVISRRTKEKLKSSRAEKGDLSFDQTSDDVESTQSTDTIEVHSRESSDDEATAVTIKWSNCSNHLVPLLNLQTPSSTSSQTNKNLSDEHRAKCEQAMRIHTETLKMNKCDFKDFATYHSIMLTSATKIAQMLISLDEVNSAEKYMNIAKFHNTCRGFDSTESTDSADSAGSNESIQSSDSSVYSSESSSVISFVSSDELSQHK